MGTHPVETIADITPEGIGIHHHLICRHRDDSCLLIAVEDTVSGPLHTGSGVAADGFEQHILFGQLGKLLAHEMSILLIGCHEDILRSDDILHPVEGLLQERTSGGEEVEELLRSVFAACRPESSALSAGKYHAVVIVVVIHIALNSMNGFLSLLRTKLLIIVESHNILCFFLFYSKCLVMFKNNLDIT